MYICSCNVFTDHDVKNFLKDKDGKTSVAQAYRHCSGGKKPNCGSCLPTVKKMVVEHNARVTVEEINKSLPVTARKTVNTPSSS